MEIPLRGETRGNLKRFRFSPLYDTILSMEARIKMILERNVEEVIRREALLKKLRSKRKLRIKHGIDPTTKNIHLGRAVSLRKLKDFEDLGHKIVLIIGDFTAQIGDPSDKLEKRPFLSEAQVKHNLKNYLPQIGKIINLKKAEIHYNSTWLTKLNFREISKLAEMFSVGQMLERRNFKLRFQKQEEISLREFLYPLMQGYDSVAVRADVEIGGSDQLFNLLAGRKVQEFYHQPLQDIITTAMLEGTDGRKMSSSWGNVITIVDDPALMFGKVMALNDAIVGKYFLLATDLPEEEIKEIRGKSRLEAKERLAFEIVKLYHDAKKASRARKFFVETFRKRRLPTGEKAFSYVPKTELKEILLKAKQVRSFSEFRRLCKEGAIELNQEKVFDPRLRPNGSAIVRIGKKRFLRIVPK